MEENEFNNVVKRINLLIEEEIRDVLNNFVDSSGLVRFLRRERRYDFLVERRVFYYCG